MLRKIFCKLGLHRWRFARHKYLDREQRILIAYTDLVSCIDCGEIKKHTFATWDGNDFNEEEIV